MESKLTSYINFIDRFEYPMVLFEKTDGTVVRMNYPAQTILGKDVQTLSVQADTSDIPTEPWLSSSMAKDVMWQRLSVVADGNGFCVSGVLKEFEEDGHAYVTVLFDGKCGYARGNLTLERIIKHAGIVAIYTVNTGTDWEIRYVSPNVNQYGYTSEQFYQKQTILADILSAEDFKRMTTVFIEKIEAGISDFSFYTYIITESQAKSYVRMNVHYDRDSYGKIHGAEFLVYNLNEQQREAEENQYLQFAINKSKSVVLVKRYTKDKRVLRFISPNASTLGCNVDALKKGYRLSEDYIHPEDRDEVLDTVYKAISISAEGYTMKYRMVGDDGEVRHVRNELTVTHLSDTEADVEFLITDITEEKLYENALLKQQKGIEQTMEFIMNGYEDEEDSVNYKDILSSEDMEELIEAFSVSTGLYSVLVDKHGKFISKPYGPMEHMGTFYDLFERPYYKELYMRLNKELLDTYEPVVMEMDDGNPDSRIAGAPIMMDNKHVATWLICAYSKAEQDTLRKVYRSHWAVSARISDYLYSVLVVEKEIRRSRLNEMKLQQHIKRQEIITELLANLHKDSTRSVQDVFEKAGEFLDLDSITCYMLNEETHTFKWNREWHTTGVEFARNRDLSWKQNEVLETTKKLVEQDYLVVETDKCPSDIKMLVMSKQPKALLLLPICNAGKIIGLITMADYVKPKNWTPDEIQFARSIRDILQEIFMKRGGNNGFRAVNTSLLAAYDYFPQIVYVRDAVTGRIYYANKAANDAFGMDLKNYDSNRIAKSLEYQFDENPVMRKRFVYDRNVSNWESYIKQLDKIMIVQEISVEWNSDKDAKLVILTDKEY